MEPDSRACPPVPTPIDPELEILAGETLSAWLQPPPFSADGGSAAYLPLAGWLVRAIRPRRILGLVATTVSFQAALCEAVLGIPLDATVLTALVPGATVPPGFEARLAARYGTVMQLLAPGRLAFKTLHDIDLLSIEAGPDGLDRAVLDRLSPDAVIVVHGTGGRPGRWSDDLGDRRRVEFERDGGLALVAWNDPAPRPLEALFGMLGADDPRAARLRTALSTLGEGSRHRATVPRRTARDADAGAIEAELRRSLSAALQARQLAERAAADTGPLRAALARSKARRQELLASIEHERARNAALLSMLAVAARDADLAHRRDGAVRSAATTAMRDALARAERAEHALAGVVASRPMRLARLVRRLTGRLAKPAAQDPTSTRTTLPSLPESVASPDALDTLLERWRAAFDAGPPAAEPPPGPAETRETPDAADAGGGFRSILFVAGEPDQPGARYRSFDPAALCRRFGRTARAVRIEEVGPDTIAGVDLLVLWRAPWSDHVATMISLVHAAGGTVAFDADDLVIDPNLAQPSIIDGMRSNLVDPASLASLFERMRAVALAADVCLATTAELARALRTINARVLVIPNGFDDEACDRAAMARRRIRLERPHADPVVRIGYAAGSLTHQRDFAVAADAIARVLEARDDVRLVLFRGPEGPTLRLDEHPSVAAFADRIEWRPVVAQEALADEIARFDIAICPLETGNPFCEAKSELKYVDSALCAVPLVASPTGPYARAIVHDRNGLLAADGPEWEHALLGLIDDRARRERIGQAARADVLWRFGPRRRGELLDRAIESLGRGRQASLAAELSIRRDAFAGFGLPAIPPTETVFTHDRLAPPRATVMITSFNYAHHLDETLASVAAQSLDALELVVIDDGSEDGSVSLLRAWCEAHRDRFVRISVRRTLRNAGLGAARNAGFADATSRHVMVLDADNRLLPACCEMLLALLEGSDAAFAYSTIAQFGDRTASLSGLDFDPWRLMPGNYIDAMAMVATWAWSAAGGYYDNPDARGWEDFDLWCRLVELGQRGVWHAEPLAEYRVHADSMTNSVTERARNKANLVRFLEERHGWLALRSRSAELR